MLPCFRHKDPGGGQVQGGAHSHGQPLLELGLPAPGADDHHPFDLGASPGDLQGTLVPLPVLEDHMACLGGAVLLPLPGLGAVGAVLGIDVLSLVLQGDQHLGGLLPGDGPDQCPKVLLQLLPVGAAPVLLEGFPLLLGGGEAVPQAAGAEQGDAADPQQHGRLPQGELLPPLQ